MNPEVIRKALRDLNFDLVYLAGIQPEEVNRYNRYDQPFFHTALQQVAEAYQDHRENQFFDHYFLDVRPQTDDRPYPGRYLKWQRLHHLHQSTGKRSYGLLLSGEIVIAAVFFEAVIISVVLLGCSLLVLSKPDRKGRFSRGVYFTGIGGGFILLEVFFIQHYTCLLGDPIISFAVVIGGVLSASGAGGLFAQRLNPRALRSFLLALILMLALVAWCFNGYLQIARTWPPSAQYASGLLIVLSTGFLMGIPFTVGMRRMASSGSQKAYAWAANGCASVLGSILAAHLGISVGITAMAVGSLLAYAAAFLSTYRFNSP